MAAKKKGNKKPPVKRGRPPSYRPEFCQVAQRMYGQGATDQEVADALKITVRTLYRWHHDYPEFCQASKLAKDPADDRVERALYHRAVGYSFDSVKIFQGTALGPVIVPYREHVPPDPGAAKQWLANRRPELWRETQKIDQTVTVIDGERTREVRNRIRSATAAGKRPA